MDIGWESFEGHDRKRLDYLGQTISTNTDVGDSTSDDSGENEKHGRENLSRLREYLSFHEQTVGRNMDIKGIASESSDRKQGQVIENWRKRDSCYIVAETQLNCVFPLCGKQNL